MNTEQEGMTMKKLIAMLLALMLCLPAWAETTDVPGAAEPRENLQAAPAEAAKPVQDLLAPYVLTVPEGVTAEENAGGVSRTYVCGGTRVVAMVLDRVLDAEGDHEAELSRLMSMFAPGAEQGGALRLPEGFHGLRAVAAGALSSVDNSASDPAKDVPDDPAKVIPIDQVTVMVLWHEVQEADAVQEAGAVQEAKLLILSGYDMTGDTAAVDALMLALLQSATVHDAPVLPVETEAVQTPAEDAQP